MEQDDRSQPDRHLSDYPSLRAHLKASGGNSIVVVSSTNGTRTLTTPGVTAYTATKAAQVAMVKQLALELAKHHLRINAVCPGEIETSIDENTDPRPEEETAIPVVWPDGQVPITGGKPGRAEDVASVICFLVSGEARHMAVSPVWSMAARAVTINFGPRLMHQEQPDWKSVFQTGLRSRGLGLQ